MFFDWFVHETLVIWQIVRFRRTSVFVVGASEIISNKGIYFRKNKHTEQKMDRVKSVVCSQKSTLIKLPVMEFTRLLLRPKCQSHTKANCSSGTQRTCSI